jgi:hypothetical protein
MRIELFLLLVVLAYLLLFYKRRRLNKDFEKDLQ